MGADWNEIRSPGVEKDTQILCGSERSRASERLEVCDKEWRCSTSWLGLQSSAGILDGIDYLYPTINFSKVLPFWRHFFSKANPKRCVETQ